MSRNTLNTLKDFNISDSKKGKLYSLPALEKSLGINVSRLPVSIRIVLESVLRNCDGKKVTEEHVKQLASWGPTAERTDEIPFVVARVVLQDFTGVPLLADLAAMRNVAAKMVGRAGLRWRLTTALSSPPWPLMYPRRCSINWPRVGGWLSLWALAKCNN